MWSNGGDVTVAIIVIIIRTFICPTPNACSTLGLTACGLIMIIGQILWCADRQVGISIEGLIMLLLLSAG